MRYIVALNYNKFVFDDSEQAMIFAETASRTSEEDIDIEIKIEKEDK